MTAIECRSPEVHPIPPRGRHIPFLHFQEQAEEGGWQAFMLELWAESTRRCYERHLRALQAAHEQDGVQQPTMVLREYLVQMCKEHQTSNLMHQAMSACPLRRNCKWPCSLSQRAFGGLLGPWMKSASCNVNGW